MARKGMPLPGDDLFTQSGRAEISYEKLNLEQR
jgi:hypothetical protein